MADRLYGLLGRQHNIHIISYAGFAVDEAASRNNQLSIDPLYYTHAYTHNELLLDEIQQYKGQSLYGLEAQCIALNNALLLIQSIQQRECRYILIAHSIGSYLTSQLQYRYNTNKQSLLNPYAVNTQLNIIHSFLCFPFIRFDLSITNNLFFRLSFYVRILIYTTGYILRALPSKWLVALLTTFSDDLHEPHSLHTSLGMILSARMIVQWMYLGRTEFLYLPSMKYKHQFIHVMRSIQHNTTMFYANKKEDYWGPKTQGEELQQQYPGLDVRVDDECTHAFCTKAHMYNNIAEQICDKIASITGEKTQRDMELSGNDANVFTTIAKHQKYSKL